MYLLCLKYVFIMLEKDLFLYVIIVIIWRIYFIKNFLLLLFKIEFGIYWIIRLVFKFKDIFIFILFKIRYMFKK